MLSAESTLLGAGIFGRMVPGLEGLQLLGEVEERSLAFVSNSERSLCLVSQSDKFKIAGLPTRRLSRKRERLKSIGINRERD